MAKDKERRPAGEGTVTPLPSGRWRLRVTTADKRRGGGVFDTFEEADRARKALVDHLAEKGAAPTGATTLGAWGRRWMDERERNGVRGVRNERSIWRNRVETHPIAALPLASVTRPLVRGWIQGLRESTAKRRSRKGELRDTGRPLGLNVVRRIRAVLRGALAGAVERELIATNPASGIVLRGPSGESAWTYLSQDEIAAVLSCDLIPPRFRCLYQFAIYTGLRRGEMWALRWSDLRLDGDRPEVHVQRSHDGPTKTGRDRRVPLLPPALAALRRLRELAKDPPPDALVFPTSKGNVRNKNDRGQWGRNGAHPGYRAVAGVERRVPFHALRHTCATALVSGFWGPAWRLEDVQKFLGHSSIKVTERYAHLSPDWLHTKAAQTAREPAARVLRVESSADTPRDNGAERGGGELAMCSSIKPNQSAVTSRDESASLGHVLTVTAETAPDGGHDPFGVSFVLARALVRGVEEGLPTRPVTAALVAMILATPGHPLREVAETYDPDGPHRVRRALDLADAALELAARRASPAPLPLPSRRGRT